MPEHTEEERKKKKKKGQELSAFQRFLVSTFKSNKGSLGKKVIRMGEAEKRRREGK